MKSKYIIWPLSMLLAFICFSCGGQTGDQAEELSGGYVYRVDGSMRYILPDHIFHEGIYPNVVAHAFDENHILVLQKPSRKYVVSFLSQDIRTRYLVLYHAGEIRDLSPEDEQILVNGYVQDSSFYSMLSKVLSPDNTAEDRKKSTEIAEELLEKNPYYSSLLEKELSYWIIDNSGGIKFGPLTREEFESQSIRLKIPEDLKAEFWNMVD